MSKENLTLTYKGAVLSNEVDSNQHMNVMYYINKFELAGRNFSSILGLTKAFITSHNLGIVVVEQSVQYKQELFEDDLIHITSSLDTYTHKVFNIIHKLYNTETKTLSAIMLCKMVLLDLNIRKVVPLPQPICDTMQIFIEDTKKFNE